LLYSVRDPAAVRREDENATGSEDGCVTPLDAVVIPSLWYENYPIAAANAVAAGVPVIVSETGGLKELVDDFNAGFVFELGDGRALADLLVRLVEDRDLLRVTRKEMLYPPSVEEKAYALEEIYNDVLAHVN